MNVRPSRSSAQSTSTRRRAIAESTELSGPPTTDDEFAAALSEVLGRKISVEHADDATFGRILADGGVSYSDLLATMHPDIRAGALDVRSDDLSNLIGRPLWADTPLMMKLVASPCRSQLRQAIWGASPRLVLQG